MRERYKELVVTYGWVFFAMIFVTLAVSMIVFFIAISAGVDIAALLAKVGLNLGSGTGEASTFAATLVLAYAASKLISVPRYMLAAALTPLVAKLLRKYKPSLLPAQPKPGE